MTGKDFLELLGYIDDDLITEAATAKKKPATVYNFVKLGAIAACLLLVLGLGIPAIYNQFTSDKMPPITAVAPGSPMPGGRKMLNYDGARYEFLGDGAQYNLDRQKLTNVLGTLQYEFVVQEDLTTTFALGGTLYEIPSYSPQFRVAVEYEGAYYIAQLVANVDDEPIAIDHYLDVSQLKENVKEIRINSHMGMEVLKRLDQSKAKRMVEALYSAIPATLADDDYGSIASAQTGGQSYLISFVLKDSTTVDMYIIPGLGYIAVGDSWYDLSESFLSEFAQEFDGLEQGPLPMG